MEIHTVFLVLMAILVTARVMSELAARLGIPPVIGELMAGVLLGPSVLGWIEPTEVIKVLAEIGIILLLFEVGLNTDVRQLVRTGHRSLTVALAGFALPFALGFMVSHWVLGLPELPSLFIGGTLTATSIGITVRVLSNLGRGESGEFRIILGAAVLDDVLGVVLLSILYEFAEGGDVSLAHVTRIVLFIGVFFLLATPSAKLLSVLISRFDATTEIPGLIPTAIVSLVLFFAWVAHAVGAPELLGGFAAGLALSRRFFLPLGLAIQTDARFAGRVVEQMRPIVHLFTPIFFVTVGLSLNLREIDWGSSLVWWMSALLLTVAIAGKMAGALTIREPWPHRIAIGIAMVPRGEVGLIFAELGRVAGILDNQVYAVMIIVIASTTMFAPVCLKWFYRRFEKLIPDKALPGHRAAASASDRSGVRPAPNENRGPPRPGQ